MSNEYMFTTMPKVGTTVLAVFTKQKDGYFEAKLVDYPYEGIMNFKDATKRRKISSWNQIVPLNKEMVASIEAIDKDTIQLSTAYFEDIKFKDMDIMQIQRELMIPFNENKMFRKFIISLCKIYNYEFSDIWRTFIDDINSLYEEYIENTEEEISMWKYFISNFDEYIENTNLDKMIVMNMKELYEKNNEIEINKIVSRFGVISLGGIIGTKQLFTNVIKNIKYNYTLKYETAPYYIFETSSEDTSDDMHSNFIKMLESESAKMNSSKVFIKTDYIARKF
jgi:hypothetical protein